MQATGEWRLGDVICDMWVAFDVLCCTASIINLAAISVDRWEGLVQHDVIHRIHSSRLRNIIELH